VEAVAEKRALTQRGRFYHAWSRILPKLAGRLTLPVPVDAKPNIKLI
jgi:hypothetical protein